MARLRSRQAETEDVNPRRLQRGAVKRQHLDRWAVGRDEIAPGVVGNVHIHPEVVERIIEHGASSGVGQLLVVEASGQSFASGGAYVTATSIVYKHGFAGVTTPGDSIVWPVDYAGGWVQVEFAWDTYTGGGTVEIEVDGVVPAWGLVGSGSSGQVGCKARGVHIAEGATVKVKVTQSSGVAQTGDVHVEFSAPDPAVSITPPPPIVISQLGPYVWYRGETLAATLADGASLSTWEDLSGNGFHLSVPVGLGAPTFRAAALNGRGVVEFDGSNDALRHGTCDLAGSTGEWTVLAVFLTDNAAAQQEIVNGDDQTNPPGLVRGPRFLLLTSAGVLTMVNEGSSVTESSGQTVTAGTWHVGESWRSTTQMEALLDAVGNGATNSVAGPPNSGLYLGYHPSGGGHAFLDGKLAEVIGWDRVLTVGERATVRAYFSQEYGV